MKTLRPHIKIYIISFLFLSLLLAVICIPLYITGFFSLQQLVYIIIAAVTGHTVAHLPFSPKLLSMPSMPSLPAKKTKTATVSGNTATCTLYVGNLLYRTKRDDLIRVFSKFGDVISARIIVDKDSRKSKGYGFVEMSNREAELAVSALNGSDLNGRALRVNEAKGR